MTLTDGMYVLLTEDKSGLTATAIVAIVLVVVAVILIIISLLTYKFVIREPDESSGKDLRVVVIAVEQFIVL